jgi:hypothetical protein
MQVPTLASPTHPLIMLRRVAEHEKYPIVHYRPDMQRPSDGSAVASAIEHFRKKFPRCRILTPERTH